MLLLTTVPPPPHTSQHLTGDPSQNALHLILSCPKVLNGLLMLKRLGYKSILNVHRGGSCAADNSVREASAWAVHTEERRTRTNDTYSKWVANRSSD
jgi:hypothetical protein